MKLKTKIDISPSIIAMVWDRTRVVEPVFIVADLISNSPSKLNRTTDMNNRKSNLLKLFLLKLNILFFLSGYKTSIR